MSQDAGLQVEIEEESLLPTVTNHSHSGIVPTLLAEECELEIHGTDDAPSACFLLLALLAGVHLSSVGVVRNGHGKVLAGNFVRLGS